MSKDSEARTRKHYPDGGNPRKTFFITNNKDYSKYQVPTLQTLIDTYLSQFLSPCAQLKTLLTAL